jgi:hypothetical protein
MTKGGLDAVTRALAIEYAKEGNDKLFLLLRRVS